MFASCFRCVFALVLSLVTGAAMAGQSWLGLQIMPKSEDVRLQSDSGSSVGLADIGWPATVLETKGRYLRVQDEGGYSRNQAGGWIYADDVVKLDDARDHYTDELRLRETPWLYWMRGISWEGKGEPGIALFDYQSALRADPQTRLDDVHIRLGRLLAQQQLQSGRRDAAQRTAWEDQFRTAQHINGNRPQLYYEWGLALSQACGCTQVRAIVPQKVVVQARELETDDNSPPSTSGDANATNPPSNSKSANSAPAGKPQGELIAPGTAPGQSEDAERALANYEQAERLNPRWWRIPLARAELMLNQCDQESPQGERVAIRDGKPEFYAKLLTHSRHRSEQSAGPPLEALAMSRGDGAPAEDDRAKNALPSTAAPLPQYMVNVLATALDDFNQTISLNPNALDAYRDRGEVLRLLRRLEEAKQSATIACKLSYYRQVGSLRTLAQINHDQQLYEPASDFALRAAELATGDEQQRFLKLWYKCSKLSQGDTAKIAVASAQAGYVAARGDGSDTEQEAEKAPPAHIAPPPGFLPRAGSAIPD